MKHMMIDCETLGLRPGAALLTIGAVVWDDVDNAIFDKWVVRVDALSCMLAGLHVEQTTVDWWRQQSPEAQAALVDGVRLSLREALQGLSNVWAATGAQRVWANGPMADIVWLEAAYRAVSLTPPWTYKQVRCFRTIVELAGLADDERATPTVKHDALADADAQVSDTMECMRRLRRQPEAWQPTHLHVKSGKYYRVTGRTLNATNAQNGQFMVEYVDSEDRRFVREINEFSDGRFVPIAAGGGGVAYAGPDVSYGAAGGKGSNLGDITLAKLMEQPKSTA